ncbi:acyl-CoA dehydrogenase family protein [Rhizobium sp. AG855]|uniref:acyl-CoA dehydrogenase family protein n=1 Tax=Rhizobium sp. AG855 TaxID=2183898 RepID=UPI000E772F97|nr:acyl-CoA dehydrogenase family protein [Rhizobium sp. AG855]RKE83418.1 acyl-CoA dehydrogenase-like protein [Rhizobium sp. AG855]
MGSITQLNDKLRTVPNPLVSDEQARGAIEDLSAFGTDDELLNAAAKKGLLAISVPSDFGGADLPNELIAELVEALARRSEEVARRALSHFVALELVRSSGTDEQRRGLYNRVMLGECLAHVGFGIADARTNADGIGLSLAVPTDIVPALHQDWTILPVVDERSGRGIAALPATALDQMEIGSDLHLPGDHVLTLGPDAEHIAQAIEVLLEAALKVGLLSGSSASPYEPEPDVVLRELLSAMIARVSGTIDALQVGAANVDLSALDRSVLALRHLNQQAIG